MSSTATECRIYVASLSDYNSGNLHGVWIDLDGKDASDVREEIAVMLRGSKYPNVQVTCLECVAELDASARAACAECGGTGTVPSAEEYAIHDSEGLGDVSEYADIDDLVTLAEGIAEVGIIFAEWRDHVGGKPDIDAFNDAYQGSHKSLEDYAYDYVESSGMLHGIDATIARYFDYESFARDMELGGDVFTIDHDGECHVFSNH